MKTITVEKMEMYYSFLENILSTKQIENISNSEMSIDLKIPLLEVENDLCCIYDGNIIPDEHNIHFLLKKIQNILCGIRYTNNCLKYFLPKNSCFVYA